MRRCLQEMLFRILLESNCRTVFQHRKEKYPVTDYNEDRADLRNSEINNIFGTP